MRGFADFGPLKPGAWADAMRRLKWLEGMPLEVTPGGGEERIAALWGGVEDRLRASAAQQDDPEELAELPDVGFSTGPKRRSPGEYF